MSTGERLINQVMNHWDECTSGAGYWMQVKLVTGEILRGSCKRPQHGIMEINVYHEHHGVDWSSPVWVNLDHVAWAQGEL